MGEQGKTENFCISNLVIVHFLVQLWFWLRSLSKICAHACVCMCVCVCVCVCFTPFLHFVWGEQWNDMRKGWLSRSGFLDLCCTKIHNPWHFSSVQFSRSVVSDSLRPHELQHARPPCPSQTPGVHPDSSPSSQWHHPASYPLASPSPALNPSQHQSLFQGVSFSHEVAKVLEFQLQRHSLQRNPRADLLQNGLVGSPSSPRDSQESSPTPQFKSINSSALSLLHSPTLTSIHDHRKNHSLD